MPSELLFEHLTPQVAENCFVEVACTASSNLWGIEFEPDLLFKILKPYANEYYFERLIKLLNEFNITNGGFDVIEIPDNKKLFRSVLTVAVLGGALCVLIVNTKKWVRDIRKKNGVKTNTEETHAVLVYGHYCPNNVHQNTWFYVYDPYDGKMIFTNNEGLFLTSYRLHKEISMGLFGLSLDPTNLLEKYPTEVHVSEISLRRKIQKTLPLLFSKKLASRHQN